MRVVAALTMAVALAGCAAPLGTDLDYANAWRARSGDPPLSQAAFDKQQADSRSREQAHEQTRLRGAGFQPAETLRTQGRRLIRATISEPRLAIRMPGMAFEPTAGGGARLSLTSDGRARTGEALVSPAEWQALAKLEAAAFAPDPPRVPRKWRRGDPLPDPGSYNVCHGWGATLERLSPAKVERVSGHGCDNTPLSRARLEYALALARSAVKAFPGCRDGSGGEAFDLLARCYGRFDPATTGDP